TARLKFRRSALTSQVVMQWRSSVSAPRCITSHIISVMQLRAHLESPPGEPTSQSMVKSYVHIKRLLEDSLVVQEQTDLVLVTINNTTVSCWLHERQKRTGRDSLLQGVQLPEKATAAEDSLPLPRELRTEPVQHGHVGLELQEPDNREGEALIRQRRSARADSAQDCHPGGSQSPSTSPISCLVAVPHASSTNSCLVAVPRASSTNSCLVAVPHASSTNSCLVAVPHASSTNSCLVAVPHASSTNSCFVAVPHSSSTNSCLVAVPHSSSTNSCFVAVPHASSTNSCFVAVPQASSTNSCLVAVPHSSSTNSCLVAVPQASSTNSCLVAVPQASSTNSCLVAVPQASSTNSCLVAVPQASSTNSCLMAVPHASSTNSCIALTGSPSTSPISCLMAVPYASTRISCFIPIPASTIPYSSAFLSRQNRKWRHEKSAIKDQVLAARGEPPIKEDYHYQCKSCGQSKRKNTDHTQLTVNGTV
ncbi:hypothetical protein KUCAC02_031357, partial [Chaenocephalus aceratus]